ncbi:unnamed protein product [Leptidea sinapis]|uniref:Carboxylesterase type B domain-containing protein n=1 Tax=Leptidea sinapis TaxID=189913 RepID=A0A5E4PZG9_9NEOP|nr:unnamed protein product [Leptidea sinapis]
MFFIILLSLLTAVLSAREPKQINLANQGTIAGIYITRFRTKRIAAYLGIPYAQPPIEFRRFSPPEYTDLPQWEGVRNATTFTPDCMQSNPKKEDVQNPLNRHDELFNKLLDDQLEEPRRKEYSEDCLYLNVYVPDDLKVESYPTLVWFHGGNFVRGSPNTINPFQLVLKQKVIFVSMAYRLNIFGFFSTLDNEAPGNFGLLDQVAALNWVKNNIDCLRRVNNQALLDIGEPLAEWKPLVDNGFSNISLPFLTELPSKMFEDEIFSPVPVLTGYTNMEDALLLDKDGKEDSGISQREFDVMREEVILSDITVDNSSCFTNQHHIQDAVAFFYKPIPPTTNETILRKLFLDFYTDKVYGATTYKLAKHLSKHAPVYLYRFDLKPFSDIANDGIPDWIAVPHNFDLIFTFGLPYLALPEDLTKWDYRDKSISEIVMKMWSNFAWYSNPTNSGVIIQWDPFESDKPGYFIIDRQNFTMSTPETVNYKAFEFWTDFYPKVVEIGTKCCKEVQEESRAPINIGSLVLLLFSVKLILCIPLEFYYINKKIFQICDQCFRIQRLVRTARSVLVFIEPLPFQFVYFLENGYGSSGFFGDDVVVFGAGFGDDGQPLPLPIEAKGDRDLVDRISKLPIDKQPFWYINWKALEENRRNPQTYELRPNPFLPSQPVRSNNSKVPTDLNTRFGGNSIQANETVTQKSNNQQSKDSKSS